MEALAIFQNREGQKYKRKILNSGLKAIENLTYEEFEGLKLILEIILGKAKVNDRAYQSRPNT